MIPGPFMAGAPAVLVDGKVSATVIVNGSSTTTHDIDLGRSDLTQAWLMLSRPSTGLGNFLGSCSELCVTTDSDDAAAIAWHNNSQSVGPYVFTIYARRPYEMHDEGRLSDRGWESGTLSQIRLNAAEIVGSALRLTFENLSAVNGSATIRGRWLAWRES